MHIDSLMAIHSTSCWHSADRQAPTFNILTAGMKYLLWSTCSVRSRARFQLILLCRREAITVVLLFVCRPLCPPQISTYFSLKSPQFGLLFSHAQLSTMKLAEQNLDLTREIVHLCRKTCTWKVSVTSWYTLSRSCAAYMTNVLFIISAPSGLSQQRLQSWLQY